MPNLLQFNPAQFIGFAFIFARLSGVMITAPVLNDANIPVQVKVAFTFLLSLILFPVVARPEVGPNPDVWRLAFVLAGEVAVGVLIGFTAQVLFAGIGIAGEVIGFQMGLGVANVFDPVTQAQASIVGQFKTVVALMLFVALDGHHLFLQALAGSYAVVPAGGVAFKAAGLAHAMDLAGRMFVIGLQLGAPLIVALLAANVGIGLVARAVPQVNIFVVGYPFTIAAGLVLLMLATPFFLEGVALMQRGLEESIQTGLRALR